MQRCEYTQGYIKCNNRAFWTCTHCRRNMCAVHITYVYWDEKQKGQWLCVDCAREFYRKIKGGTKHEDARAQRLAEDTK